MYHKHRDYRRCARVKAIKRRSRIASEVFDCQTQDKVTTGKLAKGKVHCSCPICSCKSTRFYGHTNNSVIGYPKRERARIIAMKSEIRDY